MYNRVYTVGPVCSRAIIVYNRVCTVCFVYSNLCAIYGEYNRIYTVDLVYSNVSRVCRHLV